MIKALVFDCYGVLTTDGWLPFKQAHFGHDKARLDKASELSWRANRGLLTTSDFFDQVAELANCTPSEARQAINQNMPNDELFAYIREHKPNYKIGMLSNAGSNNLSNLFSEEQIRLFDTMMLSHESGYAKPHPQSYRLIADKLNCEPAECIFIDDQASYCEAAQAEGMQAIVYESFEQLKTALTSLLA
jgi:HAD superfamily hydrolase (TIGR01509 family)